MSIKTDIDNIERAIDMEESVNGLTSVTIDRGTETEHELNETDIELLETGSSTIKCLPDELMKAYVNRTIKVKMHCVLITLVFVNILIHFVLGFIRFPSAKDTAIIDPYFEEVLADRIISSQDFQTAVNKSVLCINCPYEIDESNVYRSTDNKCCFRDISSVQKSLKKILKSKTDNLKERVQELEVLRDNLEVIGKATNNSDHVTVVQKTTSSVSNELLQELFSRKKSAIHLRGSGDYKQEGHEYHVLWSNVDTTKRNLDVVDSGSTVTIATEGFYFLYCKIMFFQYRTATDTDSIHDSLIYQIRRKRSGTAFLLEETRQKWERIGETLEYQSTVQMVHKLDAGDMIYISFPGNQIQSFNNSIHATHSLGLFEL